MFSSSIFLVSFFFSFFLLKSLLDLEFDLVESKNLTLFFFPEGCPVVNTSLFFFFFNALLYLSISMPYL